MGVEPGELLEHGEEQDAVTCNMSLAGACSPPQDLCFFQTLSSDSPFAVGLDSFAAASVFPYNTLLEISARTDFKMKKNLNFLFL